MQVVVKKINTAWKAFYLPSFVSVNRFLKNIVLNTKKLNKNNSLYIFLGIAFSFSFQVQAEEASENAVKAAFLYNVLKFIEFPKEIPQDVFNICTTDSNALGDKILVLRGKSIDGRGVNLIRGVVKDELASCHLIYVGVHENPDEIARYLLGTPVVTVSDKEDFVKNGGMIGLVLNSDRLTFEVNLKTAKASNIRIYATLLKLAKTTVVSN